MLIDDYKCVNSSLANLKIIMIELFNKIMWSDESSFKLNGMINGHSCVIYATENPHLTYEKQLN